MKKHLLLALLAVVLCAGASGQIIGTETEPNDNAASANNLVLGSYAPNIAIDTGCHMQTGTDVDYYKITIPQGGVLNVTVPLNGTGIDFYIDIIDSATYSIINSKHSTTPVSTETLICGGTYYIEISNWSGVSSLLPYSLNVDFYPDVTECNNTAFTAYPINPNDTITGYIRGYNTTMAVSYDIDYYKVRNTNCGFLSLYIPVNSTITGFYLDVIDSVSNTTVSTNYTSAPGAALLDTASVSYGTYYIKVTPYIINSDPNPYTLYVNLTECPSLGIQEVNEALEKVSIYPNPNNGSFTVNVPAGNQPVKITVTNIIGEKLKEVSATTAKPIDIDLNEPPGIYFVTIATASYKSVHKTIISK